METAGDLKGTEVFIFTDNSTAERAYFKGFSTSRILHELGVMRGEEMTSFITLHLNALERSPELRSWIESWLVWNNRPLEFLEPIYWYERGHDFKGSTTNCDGQWLPEYVDGCYIWAFPPAAAGIALEELRKACQKI